MSSKQPPHDIAVRAHLNATYGGDDEPMAAKAQKYMEASPEIYQMFCRFAWEYIMGKRKKRIGGRMIWERMRWETAIRGTDDFKLNNNYLPFLVRRFQKENPKVADVFTTRGGKHVSSTASDTGAVS